MVKASPGKARVDQEAFHFPLPARLSDATFEISQAQLRTQIATRVTQQYLIGVMVCAMQMRSMACYAVWHDEEGPPQLSLLLMVVTVSRAARPWDKFCRIGLKLLNLSY